MSLVQVVGAANATIVDTIARTALYVHVSFELLELGEERSIGEMAVHDAANLVHVIGDTQIAPGFLDRFEVSRRDVSSDTD